MLKVMISFSLWCILSPGFHQQVSGQELPISIQSNIEKQIDSIFSVMVKAAENMNYDQLSSGVDDQHEAGFLVNNNYYWKYDSLASVLKTNQRTVSKQRITFQNKKITVLSDTIALLTASGDSYIELNSNQSLHVKFLWSFVYKKIGEDWKVIQSHQSRVN